MLAQAARPSLVSGLILLVACAGDAEPRVDPDLVLEGLLPGVLVEGEPDPDWTLSNRMAHYGVPGVAVALVADNELAWVVGRGILEVGADAGAVEPNTPFMAKSISKPVSAFAALRLVESGRIDLNEALSTYLRRWSVPENEFTAQRQPTLAHVLSHSAGFTVWGVPSYEKGEPLPTLLQALLGVPPARPEPVGVDYVPGTASRYSGGGYTVLQLLLEDVTGDDFSSLMDRIVFGPVGMDRSVFFSGMPDSLVDTAARGHGSDGNPIPGKWEALVQMAAGGIVTTAGDLATFVAELNRALAGESELLGQELAEAMVTEVRDGFGLGVEVIGTGDSVMFYHTGSGDGFRALIVGVPGQRSGAVVLANSDAGGELRYELVRAMGEALGWPGFRAERRDTVYVGLDQLVALTGEYEYSDGSRTTVRLTDGALHAAWRDGKPSKLYPQSKDGFFTTTGEAFVFDLAGDGSAAALTWSGSFGAFKAQRIR